VPAVRVSESVGIAINCITVQKLLPKLWGLLFQYKQNMQREKFGDISSVGEEIKAFVDLVQQLVCVHSRI